MVTMEQMKVRITALETSLSDVITRIDAYVNRMDENDKNVKGTIETKLQEMQTVTNKQLQAHKQKQPMESTKLCKDYKM